MNIWKRGVCLLLTLVMAAALAEGTTVIENAARGSRRRCGYACRSCRGRWTRLWSPRTPSASW